MSTTLEDDEDGDRSYHMRKLRYETVSAPQLRQSIRHGLGPHLERYDFTIKRFSSGSRESSGSGNNSLSSSVEERDNPYKLIKRRIDKNRVRSKNRKPIEVSVCPSWDINMVSDHPVRAGAIIYTKYAGETLFCLGVDAEYGDLTDFGGGVKKGETVVEGGLRELEEESLGVFGRLCPDQIENVTAVHSNNLAIMFIPIVLDIEQTIEEFKTKIAKRVDPEVKEIVWLSSDEFLESINGRGKKMYNRARKVLSKVTDIIQDL